MKPAATRVGRVAGVTLPRTVSVTALIAAGIGSLVGVGVLEVISSGVQSVLYGIVFGGGMGYVAVTFSPLKGESSAKWVAIQLNATLRGRWIDGRRVTLAVGTAVLGRQPAGQVRLLRSAVGIPAGHFDDRGVAITRSNGNVGQSGAIDPTLFATLAMPKSGSRLTPASDGVLDRDASRGRQQVTAPAPAAPTPPRRSVRSPAGSPQRPTGGEGTTPARRLTD